LVKIVSGFWIYTLETCLAPFKGIDDVQNSLECVSILL
jgi:hypothetical protein